MACWIDLAPSRSYLFLCTAIWAIRVQIALLSAFKALDCASVRGNRGSGKLKKRGKNMRPLVAFAVKALISGLLLYLALDFVNLGTLRGRLSQIEWPWILAAFTVMAVQLGLVSLRWQQIALACGTKLSRRTALLYMVIASFFNQTLPSTIGGDAARIWLVAHHHSGWKGAVYSVLIDRGAGLLWLALIVLACLPWSLSSIPNPVGRITLIAISAASIAGIVALFTIDRSGRRWLTRWRLTRHLAEIASVTWRVLTWRHIGFAVAVLSAIGHFLTALTAWCVAKAIGSSLDLVQALLLILPVALIASIPISIAGWGVREAAMVTAFVYTGLPQGDGLLVSLLIGAENFAMGAVGGLTWVLSGEQIKASHKVAAAHPR
jgi:uncharacterized protein (TIRG00374 family)